MNVKSVLRFICSQNLPEFLDCLVEIKYFWTLSVNKIINLLDYQNEASFAHKLKNDDELSLIRIVYTPNNMGHKTQNSILVNTQEYRIYCS